MKLLLSSNAKTYADAISRYANETGKSFGEALAREGPEFRLELFQQFRAIQPSARGIRENAKGRNFRVRRTRNSNLVPIQEGVSARALRRARELLDGQKSDFFRWLQNDLVPVRFSGRKHRRVLRGGRHGRRFAKSALRAHQLAAEELARFRASDDFGVFQPRRLNLRALAVHLEIVYRQRGAQGGAMAIQWLFKYWKKGRRFSAKQKLVQRSATGVPIGEVEFITNREGVLSEIAFHGFVPGTGEQAQKRGIIERVFSARSSQLLRAIELHHAKAARQHGL